MSNRKTALVTGASSGIGRAVALQLAADGCQVAIHYNANHSAAEDTRRQMAGEGHLLLSGDLSNSEAVELLARTALNGLGGRVDILVHNAGIYLPTPLLQTSSLAEWREEMRAQMQINFWAGADLAFLLAPAMAEAGWGRFKFPPVPAFAAKPVTPGTPRPKAAQTNFVRSLSMELGPVGIGCFAVAPGWTETDMAKAALAGRGDQIRAAIPLGRVATPQDIASLVGFLVTDAADYLSGNTIDVNGASYLH